MQTINHFLKRTGIFLFFPVAICMLTLIYFSYSEKKALNEFKLNININTIFIGDSHIQTAINDKVVENSINLSQDSESYFYSFYKIAGLLKNNPSIKQIYLGFSYHSLSSYYEDYIFGPYSKDISARYFFILPFSEKLNFLKYNLKEFPIYLKKLFAIGLENLLSKDNKFSYLGNYQNNFKNSQVLQQSMDNRLAGQFYKNQKLNTFSNYNIYYLKQIIDLCQKNKVELVLLNTPLHNYFKNRIPKKYIEKYNEIISINHLKVFDFNELTLRDSYFAPDGSHVSRQGALRVSKYLKYKLRKGY